MNTLRLLATGAALALAAPAAYADCAADLAALEGGAAAGGGISKDGSLAPLEGAAGSDSATTGGGDMAAGADGIAKDGTHTPLEGQGGGSQAGVAMSGDDAQAQQEGQPTAAEAADNGGQDKRAAAIQRAHEALAAQDEEACRKALEEAKAL